MTPYYADSWLTLYGGDCRTVLPTLPAESVHCVVTSPPYWGLRDYGTATWTGGDPDCDHKAPQQWASDSGDLGERGHILNANEAKAIKRHGVDCRKCGAQRRDAQLGLEPTPEEYVANLVAVFREVRRVLRDDGTLWLNLGDSYASGEVGRVDGAGVGRALGASQPQRAERRIRQTTGLKPKDLVGIPWRVAFALQADGWYLRSDIIWSKPNPMPESVTDRPTKSHEYLFLLAKSARYYFDADAVAETSIRAGDIPAGGHKWAADGANDGRTRMGLEAAGARPVGPTRNIRSVWTVATAPYPGAHFATFPPKLVEPCIKAGCPELGTVLDPFAGSGTVGMVAQRLSRRAVLIDLNPEYLKQQLVRNANIPLGLSA